MRTKPTKERAESRIVSKYHKLYPILIELVQAIEGLAPNGMQLGNVEFMKNGDRLQIAWAPHPMRLTLHSNDHTFMLQIMEPSKKEKAATAKKFGASNNNFHYDRG